MLLLSIVKFFIYVPIRFFYPTKVIGGKNVPKKGACVIAGNHKSNLDPFLLVLCCRRQPRMLGKDSLFKGKFKNWFFRSCGFHPVNRGKTDIAAIKFGLSMLKDGQCLGIFPEGTRVKDESIELGQFKNGAAMFASRTSSPIIPMIILNKPKMFRRNILMFGTPFMPEGNDYDAITQVLTDKMKEMRIHLESKNKKKKHHTVESVIGEVVHDVVVVAAKVAETVEAANVVETIIESV
ncbi:MAG: 1-acyl-sn-glycerol-3-phosphate acyltransferase [Firmicutes bacterium]|nr:1-acyl-sn-glycerol-3-phosphate acyltransferase [Bacillota bacterium]